MRQIWKESRIACAGLMVLIVLSTSFVGYVGVASGQAASADSEPFIADRVVEVRIIMTDEDWETCLLDALEEEYVQADFWFDGELVPDVAVRPKGNSSLNMVFRSGSPRLSLKVDFNFFNSARTFRGLKKLNLNNGFNDPTLIREHIAYEVYNLMDIPTPRTSFVDLWVNDMHMGLYTQVEQVDKTFLERHFSDPNGNLYKPEMPAGYLKWTEADMEQQRDELGIPEPDDQDMAQEINMGGAKLVDIMTALEGTDDPADSTPSMIRANPSERMPMDILTRMGLKTNESYPDHTALLDFLEILNNEPDETFPEEIEKVLDVDGALKFIAVAGTVGYFDSYLGMGHNYYLYEINGKFTILPWDLNGAFGSFTGGMSRDSIINCYIDEPTSGPVAERPLIDRLLSHEPYLELYHQHLETLLEGPFDVNRMASWIDEVADMVRPYVKSDDLKFFSFEDFEQGLSEDVPRGSIPPSKNGGTTPVPVQAPLPQLSPKSLECIKTKLPREVFLELRTRKPNVEELRILEDCLAPQELAAFLGQGTAAQGMPRQSLPPQLNQETIACLESKFDAAILEELHTRRPDIEELNKLKSCLTREEMALFLSRGPSLGAPPAGQPQTGAVFIGLKTFVIERSTSIRQQLDGKLPSHGDGSGNGGSMGMFRVQPNNQSGIRLSK
ncbi:MAG: CotH kinase family protein [Chloroflexota bacterium]|nr:CotH kinase family protein [Chloroflexota bacterium]